MGFKENLRAELQFSGMLVKELAAKSGVKKHSLDRYLDSRSQLPNVETGVKIAQALGVTVEYLVTGENNQKKTSHNVSHTARLIGQFAGKLDPNKQEFAFELLKWLLAWKDKVKKVESIGE